MALSSGQSEFYGIAKAATMGIGIKCLFGDSGLEVEVQVNTESSAAKSIGSRRGAGRVRHADVRELRVQDKVNKKELGIVAGRMTSRMG